MSRVVAERTLGAFLGLFAFVTRFFTNQVQLQVTYTGARSKYVLFRSRLPFSSLIRYLLGLLLLTPICAELIVANSPRNSSVCQANAGQKRQFSEEQKSLTLPRVIIVADLNESDD